MPLLNVTFYSTITPPITLILSWFISCISLCISKYEETPTVSMSTMPFSSASVSTSSLLYTMSPIILESIPCESFNIAASLSHYSYAFFLSAHPAKATSLISPFLAFTEITEAMSSSESSTGSTLPPV